MKHFLLFWFWKNILFFFRSQCGRQQQNNIWGLTSVCSMLPESYSASAPKATKEGNAKSERQEFPKPRKTAINQPLGDLRITENCPNLLHPAELLLKHINTEQGGKKGWTNREEGSNLQKSVFFPKAFFALRNKFSDMAKISLVALKSWKDIKMIKRHYGFVIGVLELWNEPIDQKSTDQVRPGVVSEFHLGGNLTSGKWTFRRFLLSSLLGEGKLGGLLLYESSSLITMIIIIVIVTKIIIK